MKAIFLKGKVVHGKGVGGPAGFPTANLETKPGEATPPSGVYASCVEIEGKRYVGVTNVGARPTVDDSPKTTVETWLPQFSGDLYGLEIGLSLRRRLRDVRPFPDLAALREQIQRDGREALRLAEEERWI